MAGLLDNLVSQGQAALNSHITPQQSAAGMVVQARTNPYSYAANVQQAPQQQVPQQVAPPTQPLQYLLQGGVFGPQAVQPGGNYGPGVQPGFVPAAIANAQAQQNQQQQGFIF